jgi:hypothetical protein
MYLFSLVRNGNINNTMSADGGAADMMCASCGIAEVDVDDIELKECSAACKLVKYCSDACEKDHRPQHEQECKKRVAELRDELLFKQPESSHEGDCPICLLPLPLDPTKYVMQACCSKTICNGCKYANALQEAKKSLEHKCPFCRHPIPKSKEDAEKDVMKRVEANDPVAMRFVGFDRALEGDYTNAFEYLTKAAQSGDAAAHYQLSVMYSKGHGVERDEEKKVHHLEEAAIAGDPSARYYLGCHEGINGRIERAVKHWIIASNLGDDDSIQRLEQCYADGQVSKEEFAAALRAHHAAVDAMKSP